MPLAKPKQSQRELAERALNLRQTSVRESYLRRRLAAKYLEDECRFRCTPRRLAKLACAGGGPPMRYRNGLPYYPTDGLRTWVETGFGPPVTSTSENEQYQQKRALPRRRLTGLAGAKSATKRQSREPSPEARDHT